MTRLVVCFVRDDGLASLGLLSETETPRQQVQLSQRATSGSAAAFRIQRHASGM